MHLTWRRVIAALVGVLLQVLFFWKFLPYSVRERHDILPFWAAFVLTFIAGLALAYGAEEDRMKIPIWMFGGLAGANAILIVADCWHDPTNHNLWPFEFVFIAIMTAPAFVGAILSRRFEQE